MEGGSFCAVGACTGRSAGLWLGGTSTIPLEKRMRAVLP